MKKEKFNRVLEEIARNHHTTVQEVRREMEYAMYVGQSNPDPAVQAQWNSIPRKGDKLTLEEFIDYIIKRTMSS